MHLAKPLARKGTRRQHEDASLRTLCKKLVEDDTSLDRLA
jgi:hypothetical protein